MHCGGARQGAIASRSILSLLCMASPTPPPSSHELLPLPQLPEPLAPLSDLDLPPHLAVILDGNARWAKQRSLPSAMGHEAGVQSLKSLIAHCVALPPVQTLTVYAFSAENWGRPATEVNALMNLIAKTLDAEANELHRNGVRLKFIGDRERLPESLWRRCDAEEAREPPSTVRLLLVIALSYGSRQAIARAAQRLAERAAAGELDASTIDEEKFAAELRRTACGPPSDPDLVLRTGGRQRLSNFLCFEGAYAELATTECLWPDFDATVLAAVLKTYTERRRTLGVR